MDSQARVAGDSIKPGAQAPGQQLINAPSPRSGRQRFRPLARARIEFFTFTWGLRPRLYAVARFAGLGKLR